MVSLPETALLVAVVERGLRDIIGDGVPGEDRGYFAEEARDWFFAGSRRPFSFEWICEQLDWSADAIRRRIRKEEFRLPADPKEVEGEFREIIIQGEREMLLPGRG